MIKKWSTLPEEKKWVMIFAAGVIFVILVGLAAVLKPEPVALNNNNCPQDSNLINDYALVVVDGTDPIPSAYQTKISLVMGTIGRNLPKYGKFSLHDITDGKTNLTVSCSTGSNCSEFWENCGRKERKQKDLLKKAEELTKSVKEKGKSPLIERLTKLSKLSEFQNTENRSIHIFSDMLQHDEYSHFNVVTDNEFSRFVENNPNYLRNKPELQDVSVHVYYLQYDRYEHLQTKEHEKFWKELFKDAGAQVPISWNNINLDEGPATTDNSPPKQEETKKADPKQKSDSSLESTEPNLQAPSPKLVLAPPPNLVLEQPVAPPPTALSAEDVAREYRERFVRSLDTKALSDLLDLHLQNHIAPETTEMRDKIVRAVVRNDAVSPETRGKMGELFMSGIGGFDKNIKDAYLLMRCAGGYNEKIRNLVPQLDVNDVESLENDLSDMKGKKRCN